MIKGLYGHFHICLFASRIRIGSGDDAGLHFGLLLRLVSHNPFISATFNSPLFVVCPVAMTISVNTEASAKRKCTDGVRAGPRVVYYDLGQRLITGNSLSERQKFVNMEPR